MVKKIRIKILIFYLLIYIYILLPFSYLSSKPLDIQDYYDKAIEFETLERYDEAINMYLQIIEKEPEFITPILDLANLYLRQGKTEDALFYFSKILRVNPKYAPALSRMGLIHIQRNDYPAALRYLDQAQSIKPDLADIQINYSKFYYVQGMIDKAILFGKKAIMQDPNSPEAYLVTAMAFNKNHNYREAIKDFIHVVEIDHNSSFADIAISEIKRLLNELKENNTKIKIPQELYNSKQYEESRKMYLELLKEDPNNPEIYYGLASIASFVDQNNEQAIQFFQIAINNNPNYIHAYSGLALVYLVKEDIENLRYVTNKIKIVNLNQKLFQEEAVHIKNVIEKIPEKKNDFLILLEAYDYVDFEEAYNAIKKLHDKLEIQIQASKYYNAGVKFLGNNEYEKALQEFKTALQLYPNAKIIKGKWIQTLQKLRDSINKDDKKADGHYILANTLRTQEKFEEAEKEYSLSVSLDPEFPDAPGANYWLGMIYYKQNRDDLAAQKLKMVVDNNIEYLKRNYLYLDALWKLGNVYNHMGRYDDAIKILEKANLYDPRWYYLYIDLASAYINKKDYQPAIEQIKYVLKKSPGHEMAEKKLSEVYSEMGYSEKEIQKNYMQVYEQVVFELENEKRSNPYLKTYSLLLGKAYLVTQQYGKAINEFNIYLDRFPGDKKIVEQLLNIYRKSNYTPSEITKLELKMKRAYLAEEYFNKGNELYNSNQFEKAIEYYNNSLKIKENFVKAMIRIGDSYVNQKKYDEALMQYKNALNIDSHLHEVYSSIAYILNIQGNFDRAILESEKAIKINPSFPNAYNNLGYSYLKKGLYEKALREFEKAIELSPDYSSAIRNLEKTKKILSQKKDKLSGK
ncbi:tetratricopeptide repeat protein [Candidatus Desantisbacteria bacterium]|nr:tetratricopeptide repeat protein [Candidatus Desantisbacteria bacterium]